MTTSVPAASSALRIVRYLAECAAPVRATVVARDLSLPRSSVYQLLRVLMDEGFVIHYPEDRVYALSSLIGDLGLASRRTEQLARLGTPLLARLVRRAPVPAVAHLAVLSGAEVMYLAREQAVRAPTTVTSIGVRLPAHLTATGRAILAALPGPQVRALYPHTDALVMRQPVGPRHLRDLDRLLGDTRSRGWAIENGEIVTDYGSVAAAAVDRNGSPAASVGLTFRHHVPSEQEWTDMGIAAMTTARDLTARIAGRY